MQDLWIQRHQKSKPGCSRGNSTLFSYTATIVQSEFRPRHILNWVVCTCDNKYEIAPFFLTRNCNGWSRSFNVETKCWAQLRRTRSDKVRWQKSDHSVASRVYGQLWAGYHRLLLLLLSMVDLVLLMVTITLHFALPHPLGLLLLLHLLLRLLLERSLERCWCLCRWFWRWYGLVLVMCSSSVVRLVILRMGTI